MQTTFDTGISKRLGWTLLLLIGLLVLFQLAGFEVVAQASGSVKL